MHALIGDCICISDVQLIESSLLLLLFADQGFRTFIAAHRDFLTLHATPTDRFGATWPRLKSVCSGMARILGFGDNYFPNTFESVETMKHVAGMFENIKSESDANQLLRNSGKFRQFVNSYDGVDRILVVGLYHALRYFLLDEGVNIYDVPDKRISYYSELERAYENTPERQRTVRDLLADTLALRETEEERYKRSLIFKKLPSVATAGHPDHQKYLTIMQAWNAAVGTTIGADEDSAYVFRGVHPIPVLLDHSNVPNILVSAQEGTQPVAEHTWAPADISWDLLAKIRTEHKAKIDVFQDSLLGIRTEGGPASMIGANLKALTDAAGRTLAEERAALPPAPSMPSNATAIVFVASAVVAALFGSPVPLGIGAAPGLAHSYNALSRALVSRDASAIAEGLYLFGIQYNIARPSSSLQ
jgi:hypothetical protein